MQKLKINRDTENLMDKAFNFEILKDTYAKSKSYVLFRKLYTKDLPNIKNENSSMLWNKLNFTNLPDLAKSSVYKHKLSIVLRQVNKIQGKILDVGFGNGLLIKKIQNKNVSLFGIDISMKSVKEIRKIKKGCFIVGNILRIPFDSSYFDCVLALDVFEHISAKDTFKAYSEVRRVLKKGSYLIISVPLNEKLEKMIKIDRVNYNAHVRIYTQDVLKTELKIAGFVIREVETLYAFKRFYFLKNLLVRLLPFENKKPNLVIIIAQKK